MTTLPDGWESRMLGDIADTQLGKMLNSANQTGTSVMSYLRNINVRWGAINLDDLKTMDVFADELEKFTLKKGDLLVCEGGEPGRSAVWNLDVEMAFQNAIHRVRVSDGCLPEFVGLQFEWLAKGGFLDEFFTGVTIKHFSQQKLRRVRLAVPSLSEQEEIVRILDTQLARLDSVLGAVQAVRDKAAQFRRSLLRDAFNGQLTQPDPSRGDALPEEWGVSVLGELASMSLGKMLDKKTATGEHPHPYLRNLNVRWGTFALDDVAEMDIAPNELDRVTVQVGDVVVCEGGEPGRAAVWTGVPTAIQKALHRVRVGDRLLPEFLRLHLEHEFRGRSAHPLFTGTTIKHLPKDKFKTLAIPLPSTVEQAQIIDQVAAHFSRLDDVLRVADRVEVECGRLRRSLLQAAFNGEVTREWRESRV